jgi:hypothetical protein
MNTLLKLLDFLDCEITKESWYDEEGIEEGPDDGETPSSCKFCRGEDHTDEVLLEFALELLKMDREDLVSEYNIKESGEVGE